MLLHKWGLTIMVTRGSPIGASISALISDTIGAPIEATRTINTPSSLRAAAATSHIPRYLNCTVGGRYSLLGKAMPKPNQDLVKVEENAEYCTYYDDVSPCEIVNENPDYEADDDNTDTQMPNNQGSSRVGGGAGGFSFWSFCFV